MKKILVILAPIFLISNNIHAQGYNQSISNNNDRFSSTPNVNIGGFINANGAYRSQDGEFGKDRLPDTQFTGSDIQNNTGTHNKMTNNPDFNNEAEIHVKVAGINEMGMKYGGVVELEANTSTSARNEGFNADKAYIFTESRIGKMELGNNMSVAQKMKVGPDTFARGAGGINGKYLEYINFPMLADSTQPGVTQIGTCNGYRVDANGTISEFNGGSASPNGDCSRVKLPRFILIPQLPVVHGGYAKGFYNRTGDNDYSNSSANANFGFNKNSSTAEVVDGEFGDLSDATKISYYTPRISGWQLGASFTPDTGNSGTSATISGDNSGDIKKVISYGVNYSENIGNLGFAISLTGENGKFEQLSNATVKRNDLKAYEAGVMASYLGLTVGASYGNWGDSLQPRTGIYSCDYNSEQDFDSQTCDGATAGKKFGASTYYTAGAAYQFGPVASSVTYLTSNFQENEYKALSVGFDYKMAKGLMPYFEVTKFEFASNQPKSTDVDQSVLSNKERQLKDNSGYVILAGLLFSF